MAHLLALELFLEWVVKGWGLSPNSRKKSGDYTYLGAFVFFDIHEYTFLKYTYAGKYVCRCLWCACLRIGMLRFPTNGGASCG